MTSDHLDIGSVWKSLVASCVCVRLKFESAFSTCLFPVRNTFFSSSKVFVSGPAQNAFVASDNVLCLQCDSEVNSRGYLIASDKHIHLQCDIVFGGVMSCFLRAGLETPQKEQKLGGKVSEKTSFRIGMDLKKVQKEDWDEKASRTLPYYATMPAPFLASNAMHLLVHP